MVTETSKESDTDVSKMSFEEAMAELEEINEKLEDGTVPLEESIAMYERGDKLSKHCDKLLKSAESKVQKLQVSADGTPTGSEPLDVDSETDAQS